MKRLGIFVFFDKEGVVEKYIEKLLDKMQEVLTDLVIVVNGKLTLTSEGLLRQYTDCIFMRENIGYDGGAYKDVLLKFVSKEMISEYDELVLFNDTFYGPFFSMNKIFSRFEKENIDFWGLTSWKEGYSSLLKAKVPNHVQAYFLVVRKNILKDYLFWKFWEDLKYPKDYANAVLDFEVSFTRVMVEGGYQYTTWLALNGGNDLIQPGRVVYTQYPYYIMRDYQFPIIKRKAITVSNFIQMRDALEYIEEHYCYDVNCIWEHIRHYEKCCNSSGFSFKGIHEFYKKYKSIYIYGHGKIGKNVAAYFEECGWEFKSFIVSKNADKMENEINFKDLQLDDDIGIVVALGKENLIQVEKDLMDKFSVEQLYPFNGRGI